MSPQGRTRILRASALLLSAAILTGCSNDSSSSSAAATESVPPVTTTETAGATAEPTPVAPASTGQASDGSSPDGQSADRQAGYTGASAPAVALNESSTSGDATVAITSLDAVDVSGDALAPGEIGGAALQVNLSVTAGGQDVDLSGALATLTYGPDATPAAPLSAAEGTELPASVSAGQTTTGSFRFSVPADARDQVTVSVTVVPGQPAVVFQGSAS